MLCVPAMLNRNLYEPTSNNNYTTIINSVNVFIFAQHIYNHMAFLFEPYNAYQKPPKKKHWMEIAEEEALLHRIQLQEQEHRKELFHEALKQHLALREANAKQNQNPTSINNQNVALPQYFPQPAQQQVQDGQYAAPAGGGGWANPVEEEQTEQANFTFTPSIGVAPLKVFFTNTTPTTENDTFFWNFGSGSTTSNIANPGSRTYTVTGSYTVTLQATSSTGNKTSVSKGPITVFNVMLNSAFTVVSSSNIAGVGMWTFTDATTYNGAVAGGTVNGTWKLGDSSTVTYHYLSGAFSHFYATGSFTASLELIETLSGVQSTSSLYIIAVPPTLTVAFTTQSIGFGGAPESYMEPVTNSYTASVTYNGGGTLTYLWDFGTGSLTSTSVGPIGNIYYTSAGPFTASLQVTESTYNIARISSQSFLVST